MQHLKSKIAIASIMTLLVIFGFTGNVKAQPPSNPTWSLEPRTININPCEEFTLTFWIRDIPDGWSMVAFDFRIDWDPTLMEPTDFPSFLGEDRGWSASLRSGISFIEFTATGAEWSGDAAWTSITFHCLSEGVSKVILSSPFDGAIFIRLTGSSDQPTGIENEPFEITVNQVEPAPVGGVTIPTNKLEILTPYLALAGLIAAVSTVFIIKRRKD